MNAETEDISLNVSSIDCADWAQSLLFAGFVGATCKPHGHSPWRWLCDVANAAMGMAFASTLNHDESFTTINLAVTFFRPVWTKRLRAEARVFNRGKNVGYLECEINSESGKPIAKASSTCIVLRGERLKYR
jgi:hypothetical protein